MVVTLHFSVHGLELIYLMLILSLKFLPVKFELLSDLRLLGLTGSRFDSVYNRFLFSGLTLKNAGEYKLMMQILDIDYYTFEFFVNLKVIVY